VNFLLMTLAHLPYDAADEPLNIIHFVRRNVPISSTLHAAEIKAVLEAVGAHERVEGGMQPPSLGSKPGALAASLPRAASGSASDSLSAAERALALWSQNGLLFDRRSFDSCFAAHSDVASAFSASVSRLAPGGGNSGGSSIRGGEAVFAAAIMAAIESRMREGMLRLKSFLKLAYSFSDERIVQFAPTHTSLPIEIGSPGKSHPCNGGGVGAPPSN
jgi:hypothetical protein